MEMINKMIEKILWPTESFSRKSRIYVLVFFALFFGFLFLLKTREVVWDRDLSLHLIVLIYATVSCYGFLFDSDIPAPPSSGSFDRSDTPSQRLRLIVFLSSSILLCYLTFSGG
jgi:hypothetical protein